MIQTMQELTDYCKSTGKIAIFHAGSLCGFGYEPKEGVGMAHSGLQVAKDINNYLGIGACDYQTIKRCKE